MNTWESHMYCRSSRPSLAIGEAWYNLEFSVNSKYGNNQGTHVMRGNLISFLWTSEDMCLSRLVGSRKHGRRDGILALVDLSCCVFLYLVLPEQKVFCSGFSAWMLLLVLWVYVWIRWACDYKKSAMGPADRGVCTLCVCTNKTHTQCSLSSLLPSKKGPESGPLSQISIIICFVRAIARSLYIPLCSDYNLYISQR